MDLIEKALKALEQNNFILLEDVWTDMVLNEHVPFATFLHIAEGLKKKKQSVRARELLEMLASHQETNKQYHNATTTYTTLLYYSKESTRLRQKLIGI